jgi:hypothetical protein
VSGSSPSSVRTRVGMLAVSPLPSMRIFSR